MFPAKLVLSQSTRFKLLHQPLDFLSAFVACVQKPLRFQSSSHPDITALKRVAD
jgi:hypothetical protein